MSADGNSATMTVLQAGEPYQVNASWSPIDVAKDVAKTVNFSCTGGNTVTVTLKKNGSPWTTYASVEVSCDGDKTVTLTPDTTDSEAQLALNFGEKAGTYIIGTITLE